VHICLCKDGDEDCENTSVCIPAEERRKDKILTLRRRLKEKILSFGRENVRRKNRSNGPEIKPTFLKSNQPSTPYKSLSPPNASVPSLSIENLKLIKQRIRQIEMKLDKEDCSCKIRFQPGSINRRLWRRMSGRQGGRKEARRRADSKSKVGLITDKCFNSTLRCELCYHLKKFSLDATTVGDKASEFCKDGKYNLDFKSMSEDCITSDQLAEMYQGFIKVYTVLSIEDPFDHLTSATAIQIVGDDLLVTNRNRIATAIEKKNGKVKMMLIQKSDTHMTTNLSDTKVVLSDLIDPTIIPPPMTPDEEGPSQIFLASAVLTPPADRQSLEAELQVSQGERSCPRQNNQIHPE